MGELEVDATDAMGWLLLLVVQVEAEEEEATVDLTNKVGVPVLAGLNLLFRNDGMVRRKKREKERPCVCSVCVVCVEITTNCQGSRDRDCRSRRSLATKISNRTKLENDRTMYRSIVDGSD